MNRKAVFLALVLVLFLLPRAAFAEEWKEIPPVEAPAAPQGGGNLGELGV